MSLQSIKRRHPHLRVARLCYVCGLFPSKETVGIRERCSRSGLGIWLFQEVIHVRDAGQREGRLQHSCPGAEKSKQESVLGLSPTPLSLCHHRQGHL